jgi:WD40 repeat protein
MNDRTGELKQRLASYYVGKDNQLDPVVESNLANYKLEKFNIDCSHILAYSQVETKDTLVVKKGKEEITEDRKRYWNSLVWHKERRFIAYTYGSSVIIENLVPEKTQKILKEGNDPICSLDISPNGNYLLAFTHSANFDGFPSVYIWDANTFRRVA